MEEYLRVGTIANTHGIKGEVKVFPTTDDVKRFDVLKETYLDNDGELIKLNVIGVKYFKNLVILKFKEFNNINEIEKYKGKDLLVNKKDAYIYDKSKNFISDLIGCDVITDKDEHFGVLTDVLKNAANDVFIVTMDDKKEVLLPVIDECILKRDIENKKIYIHVMKGLLD